MRLPPLTAVRFFEATARRLSVKVAAGELHVTSGAVSQQVRKLEAFLGCALFERLPRGLALTAAGREYHCARQEALALIGRATTKLTTGHRRPILVSCTPSFASQWLVSRLQGFMQTSPDIDVHVSTTNRVIDLANEGIHFAIRHGLGHYPGLKAEVLVDDDLVPVCSPQLIAPRKVARASDISGRLLLHDEHREDWRLWFDAAGIRSVDCSGGVVFTDSNAVIEAALAGLGYALIRRALVQSEIASARMLCVRAPALRTPLAYHLLYRAETLIDPALRSFRDWLVTQRVS